MRPIHIDSISLCNWLVTSIELIGTETGTQAKAGAWMGTGTGAGTGAGTERKPLKDRERGRGRGRNVHDKYYSNNKINREGEGSLLLLYSLLHRHPTFLPSAACTG